MSLMRSTSSGQTSTQTVQPLSAMHFASSTTTGTVVLVVASGIAGPFALCCRSDADPDALLVVEVLLIFSDRDHVGLHCALLAYHAAVLLSQQRVAKPILIIFLWIVRAKMIEA